MWSDIKDVARDLRAELLVAMTRNEALARIAEIRNYPPQHFAGSDTLPFINQAELVARFDRIRALSLGKYEPQVIGLELLRQSSRAGAVDNKWKAIPWPPIVSAHVGNPKKMLLQLAHGCSYRTYWKNIEGLAYIAENPGEVVQVFSGRIENMIELTTGRGQPYSALIGVHFLLDHGLAEVCRDHDGPDMLVPTAKLIERAQEQIANPV